MSHSSAEVSVVLQPHPSLEKRRGTGASTLSVTIAILTYRRPTQLARTVRAVTELIAGGEPLAGISADVLVIDNDADRSARSLTESDFPSVRYVCEPEPGIAAARNRALLESATSDLLIFIDDDEMPRIGWHTRLIETWRSSGALAVVGRVVPSYQAPPDSWILAGGFFDRPVRGTNSRMSSLAAGNLLLDLRQLRESGLTFEEPFGATGGEDSLLGQRAALAGYQLVSCDDSVVEDMVPIERLTRGWVLRRAYSHGNLQALIDCELADGMPRTALARARRVLAGSVLVSAGLARAALGYVGRSEAHQAKGLRKVCRGLGMCTGAAGSVYEQYAHH